MFTKEEIRQNRRKMRLSMQGCLITINKEMSALTAKTQIEKNLTSQKKSKKRKQSQNLQIQQKFNFMKELYTNKSFSDLFILKEKLGEGTHSVVYKCLEKDSDEICAVKVIRSADPQIIAFVKEQYKILKSLNHNSIMKVKYLIINEKDNVCHLVTELCQGKNLKEYMLEHGRMKQSQVVLIIYSILNALAFMHKKGIAHRDIKPENIMFDQETKAIKIIDFQISKRRREDQDRLEMLTNTGTLHYKAPQMFKGLYNEQIDIWAIGIMVYEMITQQMPFKSQFIKETIIKICQEEPIISQKLFTQSCQEFLIKCLTKNPLNRYTAIEALKSPFIMKHGGASSTNTPKLHKKFSSFLTQQDQNIEQTELYQFNDELTNTL